MSGSGRETLAYVREWSGGTQNVRVWSGRPPRYPGVPPDVRVWLGGLRGCPGVVEMTSKISGSGREAIPDV